jgi:hypothetical protein
MAAQGHDKRGKTGGQFRGYGPGQGAERGEQAGCSGCVICRVSGQVGLRGRIHDRLWFWDWWSFRGRRGGCFWRGVWLCLVICRGVRLW